MSLLRFFKAGVGCSSLSSKTSELCRLGQKVRMHARLIIRAVPLSILEFCPECLEAPGFSPFCVWMFVSTVCVPIALCNSVSRRLMHATDNCFLGHNGAMLFTYTEALKVVLLYAASFARSIDIVLKTPFPSTASVCLVSAMDANWSVFRWHDLAICSFISLIRSIGFHLEWYPSDKQ